MVLIKMEFGNSIFTGLEIPRVYCSTREVIIAKTVYY
ncbi:hypothetical protein IMSAGC007_02941 [Lachnospiraceae bacterium]|nr:hypothetical protein IMSAGC007_02941 [Lachnospiraceae bacterium]